MSDAVKQLWEQLNKSGFKYAALDMDDKQLRILVSPKDKDEVKKLLLRLKWRKEKGPEEIYLYGMGHFSYFEKDGISLTVCYQVACRSTLHGEWVPLDRKINNFALTNVRSVDGVSRLCPEDELCYLLAKCVYTEKGFSNEDQTSIKKAIDSIDNDALMPKLEGVFFKFSPRILTMAKDGRFDEIIPALWRFGEYE